jgi:hypothetical protein
VPKRGDSRSTGDSSPGILEEFQKLVQPELERIASQGTESDSELAAGTAVAVAAETGRSIDEVLHLMIEDRPGSSFAYSPPRSEKRCGTWTWDPVIPRYESEFVLKTGFEVDRADHLSYAASELVTDLITRYTAAGLHRGTRLFPYKAAGFRKIVRQWLSKPSWESRFTNPGRISHLAWNVLHSETGGELATVCLVLGLPHTLAQVELFYSVLEVDEAASLFARARAKLWGTHETFTASAQTSDLDSAQFVGCRPFPRMSVTIDAIKWFREGSEEFFTVRVASFDPDRHSELLNRAMMYAVWHQFFSFGTRAIVDAYQSLCVFSKSTGLGVLSDKDFSTGYEARIVFARLKLQAHMKAIENRLAQVVRRFPENIQMDLGPVWLFNANKQPVDLTATTIQEVMKEKFPFPVNTPRKVMRHLLRKAGMSHTYAEAYMGHWWHGREPFSPFSSFNFGRFVADLKRLLPDCLETQLGFTPVPGVRER